MRQYFNVKAMVVSQTIMLTTKYCQSYCFDWRSSLYLIFTHHKGMSKPKILHIIQITVRNRFLLNKLTVLQLVKKLPGLYENWNFSIAIKSAHNFSPFWARWIQSVNFHPICVTPNTLKPRPSEWALSDVLNKELDAFILYPMSATCAANHMILNFSSEYAFVRSRIQ